MVSHAVSHDLPSSASSSTSADGHPAPLRPSIDPFSATVLDVRDERLDRASGCFRQARQKGHQRLFARDTDLVECDIKCEARPRLVVERMLGRAVYVPMLGVSASPWAAVPRRTVAAVLVRDGSRRTSAFEPAVEYR